MNVKISKFGVTFYNNAISCVLLVPVLYATDEISLVQHNIEVIYTGTFIGYLCLAGVLGIALSGSALWTVSLTSATTLAIVGSMNKIPITVLGFLIFPDSAKTTSYGALSMCLSIAGGFVYAYSKLNLYFDAPLQQTAGAPQSQMLPLLQHTTSNSNSSGNKTLSAAAVINRNSSTI